ncbi:MAG: flagellar protein [Schwartzia sp.]|nr:flagellar protein [Schwartzia sp. (in: firmicutes)]
MANKLKNCPECGRIYVDTGVGLCRDCFEKEEDTMQEIASYVRDNPNSKVKDIVDALGVKERLVMRMIRDGWFVTEGASLEYPCERCGTAITSGRFCDKCNAELQKEMERSKEKLIKQAAAEAARAAAAKNIKSLDMGNKL